MNQPNAATQPRILVAPLDWGLGHATRSIPIIRLLLQKGCAVFLAGEGKVEHLLRTEFPQLPFLALQGYRVHYAATGLGLVAAMVRQIPAVLKTIREENSWLQKIVAEYGIDAVISDNRYGLYHPSVYSILITHQLQIQTPFGPSGNALLQKLTYRFINRFNACWVPDNETAPGLAGALSHPAKMPQVPITYLGPLSRFSRNGEELAHYILVLLSGPEPQRTLLEHQLLEDVKQYTQPVLFVRGLPGTVGLPKVPYHVTIVNHLAAHAAQKALDGAQYVIARTGYSTVMELMALQKKSILIPTPGQTEQLYLAKLLQQQRRALCLPQAHFNLSKAIALAENFLYKLDEVPETGGLEMAVDELLLKLNKDNTAKENISKPF